MCKFDGGYPYLHYTEICPDGPYRSESEVDPSPEPPVTNADFLYGHGHEPEDRELF